MSSSTATSTGSTLLVLKTEGIKMIKDELILPSGAHWRSRKLIEALTPVQPLKSAPSETSFVYTVSCLMMLLLMLRLFLVYLPLPVSVCNPWWWIAYA